MSAHVEQLASALRTGHAAHETIADALRRRIALGGFEPGETLPPERELATELEIGRATLRDALRQLAAEGLVATTRGRSGGTVVLGPDRAVAPTVRRRLLREVGEQIEHTLEVRLALEPEAAALAAARRQEEERRELRELLDAPASKLGAYHTLDSRLHLAVARASQNPLLVEHVERVRTQFFGWANVLWLNVDWAVAGADASGPDAFRRDHLPIVAAIGDRDVAAARAAMVEHLQRGAEQFRALVRHHERGR